MLPSVCMFGLWFYVFRDLMLATFEPAFKTLFLSTTLAFSLSLFMLSIVRLSSSVFVPSLFLGAAVRE